MYGLKSKSSSIAPDKTEMVETITYVIDSFLQKQGRKNGVNHLLLSVQMTLEENRLCNRLYFRESIVQQFKVSDVLGMLMKIFAVKIEAAITNGFDRVSKEKAIPAKDLRLKLLYDSNEKLIYEIYHFSTKIDFDLIKFFS